MRRIRYNAKKTMSAQGLTPEEFKRFIDECIIHETEINEYHNCGSGLELTMTMSLDYDYDGEESINGLYDITISGDDDEWCNGGFEFYQKLIESCKEGN